MTREEALSEAQSCVLADGEGATIIMCLGPPACTIPDPSVKHMAKCSLCERQIVGRMGEEII